MRAMVRALPLALCLLGCGGEDAAVDGGLADAARLDAAGASMDADAPDRAVDAEPDAAADSAVDAAPDAAPDAMPGPPQAGYRPDSTTYRPLGADADRRLPLFWWYKTDDRDPRGVIYRAFPSAGAVENAAVALDAPAPLLVFSHGRSGFGQYAWFLAEAMAQRGFIVLAVEHPGDTVSDAADTADLFELRPQDVRAAIDHALSLPAGHPLAGLIDADHIALAGHSFGGYTTLAVGGGAYAVDAWQADCPDYALPRICDALPEAAARYRAGFADPRVKALIAMAPGDYLLFLDGLGAIETPVLHLTGRLDRMTTEAGSGTPIWQALQGPAHRRVQFAAGGHFTFTNLCPWIGGLGRDDGCGPDFTPPAEAHPVIIEYVWAFLQWQLFGDDAGRALLDGPPLHPAVEVLRKEAE